MSLLRAEVGYVCETGTLTKYNDNCSHKCLQVMARAGIILDSTSMVLFLVVVCVSYF